MLVLAREEEEEILIETSDGPIVIKVLEIRKTDDVKKARIGVSAPNRCRVMRTEILEENHPFLGPQGTATIDLKVGRTGDNAKTQTQIKEDERNRQGRVQERPA